MTQVLHHIPSLYSLPLLTCDKMQDADHRRRMFEDLQYDNELVAFPDFRDDKVGYAIVPLFLERNNPVLATKLID